MTVEFKKETVPFSRLKKGDVFMDTDGKIQMKCEDTIDSVPDRSSTVAISLTDGTFSRWNFCIKVSPLKAKLVVE